MSKQDEKELDNQLRIYPNPAIDDLNIQVQGRNGARGHLLIFNNGGILVRQKRCSDVGQAMISLEGLSAGHYIIVVEMENNEHFTKGFEIVK
ncbi:MAG: T9SS type A sorting domain-containing protein [Flavobacteriales bacterium]|nr:T9SS type A sorting domain-containing protein [Flavobacteriales bacterium]